MSLRILATSHHALTKTSRPSVVPFIVAYVRVLPGKDHLSKVVDVEVCLISLKVGVIDMIDVSHEILEGLDELVIRRSRSTFQRSDLARVEGHDHVGDDMRHQGGRREIIIRDRGIAMNCW